jgi:hypothetical protein
MNPFTVVAGANIDIVSISGNSGSAGYDISAGGATKQTLQMYFDVRPGSTTLGNAISMVASSLAGATGMNVEIVKVNPDFDSY